MVDAKRLDWCRDHDRQAFHEACSLIAKLIPLVSLVIEATDFAGSAARRSPSFAAFGNANCELLICSLSYIKAVGRAVKSFVVYPTKKEHSVKKGTTSRI
jgi:hypothetical protein